MKNKTYSVIEFHLGDPKAFKGWKLIGSELPSGDMVIVPITAKVAKKLLAAGMALEG